MVRAVDTGQAALEMIVTDISIPDDGLWLTREVMEAAGAMGIRIPIIAVTAYRFRGEASADRICGVH